MDSGIAYNSPLVRAMFTFAAVAVLRIAGKSVVRQAGEAALGQSTLTVTVANVVRNQSVPAHLSRSSTAWGHYVMCNAILSLHGVPASGLASCIDSSFPDVFSNRLRACSMMCAR